MTNIHSLTILHYGKDYLSYALRSIYHSVDYLHIFYTPTPSHGHSTNIPPVETKEELMSAAFSYDPDKKIRWYDMIGLSNEGQQRDMALQKVKEAGADLVVVLDYDEVWQQSQLEDVLIEVSQNSTTRNYLVNMIHFWRSFNWACYDQGWPVRVIDLRQPEGTSYLDISICRVFHFGYAITDKVMEYKWRIHGHKNEMRPNWLADIWAKGPLIGDCHPTNENGFWIPELFDKEQLPDFMKLHPFYDLEKIE